MRERVTHCWFFIVEELGEDEGREQRIIRETGAAARACVKTPFDT